MKQTYNVLHQQLSTNNIAEVVLSYRTKVRANERPKITCSREIYDILLNTWSEGQIEYREEFKLVLLNRSNRVLGVVEISQGGVAGTVCDPKLIMQAALLSNASCIILAHNHPSGNTTPSEADKSITNKINTFCKLVDIALQDHLIITKEGYSSFADEGIL